MSHEEFELAKEYDHETLELLKKKEQSKIVKPVSLWTTHKAKRGYK